MRASKRANPSRISVRSPRRSSRISARNPPRSSRISARSPPRSSRISARSPPRSSRNPSQIVTHLGAKRPDILSQLAAQSPHVRLGNRVQPPHVIPQFGHLAPKLALQRAQICTQTRTQRGDFAPKHAAHPELEAGERPHQCRALQSARRSSLPQFRFALSHPVLSSTVVPEFVRATGPDPVGPFRWCLEAKARATTMCPCGGQWNVWLGAGNSGI